MTLGQDAMANGGQKRIEQICEAFTCVQLITFSIK